MEPFRRSFQPAINPTGGGKLGLYQLIDRDIGRTYDEGPPKYIRNTLLNRVLGQADKQGGNERHRTRFSSYTYVFFESLPDAEVGEDSFAQNSSKE